MGIEWLLALHNLIFLIPLAFGLTIAIGMATGVLGHEANADIDHHLDVGHDVHHDVDGDHAHDGHHHEAEHGHSFGRWVLDFLGVGRVPIMIILLAASLIFGGIGMIANLVLAPVIHYPILYAPVALVAAMIAMWFGTGYSARLFARAMPSSETYGIRGREELVGSIGKTILDVTTTTGYLHVAHNGDVLQYACRAEGDVIPRGVSVILVGYESDGDFFRVATAPAELREGAGTGS